MSRGRGQLVLVAAAIAAIALVPMALAFLQLGAHPDVTATAEPDRADVEAVRALDRAVANASGGVSGTYAREERDAALAAFEEALAADVTEIERARLRESVAVDVRRNGSAATSWSDANCPSGPNRQFGDCVVDEGVVTQERADEVHVLAVGFDVTVTGPRGTSEVTAITTVP